MATAQGAVALKTKGRAALGSSAPPEMSLVTSNASNTLIAHRLQLLGHRHGVHGGVALAISTAFWGEADHV